MKNSIKIILGLVSISLMSCLATPENYRYSGNSGYRNNNQYYQGFSDGYRAGYFQSPDGFYYAPDVVYLDNNGRYYRNGSTYNSRNAMRGNVIISPKRNSNRNQNYGDQQNYRTPQNNNYRSQPNRGDQNSMRNSQPVREIQAPVRTQPQAQPQPQPQPSPQQPQETRTNSNESLRR